MMQLPSLYDDNARDAVVQAERLARELNCTSVGPESLLLGCLSAGGLARQALESLGVTLDRAQWVTAEVLAASSVPMGSPPGGLRYTPTSKRTIAWAIEEARRAGSRLVGTEHLLLSLLVDASLVPRVLERLELNPTQVRERVQALILYGSAPDLPGGSPAVIPGVPSQADILKMIGGMVVSGQIQVADDLPEAEAALIQACVRAFIG